MPLNFRLAALASPGSLLKLQILGPSPSPTESKSLGVGTGNLFQPSPRHAYVRSSLRRTHVAHGLYDLCIIKTLSFVCFP